MSAAKQVLVLVDGHSLAYRAFHALPQDMTNLAGEPTNAAFGFASMLLRVLETHKPEHIAVTFDRGYSGREQLYPAYKANRAETPPSLVIQMDRIRQIVAAMSIPIYESDGWEADDLLGTLSRQASSSGVETLLVTGDTDALQLVDETIRVVTCGRRFSDVVIYDESAVRDRFGVAPRQLADWKALKGDPSDNIPGVPGIGEKTATDLVATFGTVESAILHAAEKMPARIAATLAANAEQARMCLELTRIRHDAPVLLDLETARFGGYDRERVLDLFRELDFASLMERLPAQAADRARPDAARRPDGAYETVGSLVDLARLADRLRSAGRLGYDVETTSTDPMRARLVGIALSDGAGRGWYVPVAAPAAEATAEQGRLDLAGAASGEALPLSDVTAALAPALSGPALKIAHHAKYDLLVLRRHGIVVGGPYFDTMIAAWLVEPGRRSFGLKALAWSILGIEMTPIGELIGTGRSQLTMDQVPVKAVTAYAGADVDMTMRLADRLSPELEARGAQGLFADLEMPLVLVLADMEAHGVLVDRDVLRGISAELSQRLAELETEIVKVAGHPFNIGSTRQLAKVLFEELGLPSAGRTKSGYSTAAEALAGLAPAVPIVRDVLEWRHLTKLKGTYVDALPELINPATGRVHTSWGQTSAVTGRLSSSEPNLQNIPVRSEVGGQIRRAFVAPSGSALLAADYSQMELRIVAALSGDAALVEVFRTGGDVHAATGAFLFGKSPADVTPNERRIAKTVNFGILYGMGPFGLAQQTGLSRSEAAGFIDRYFGEYTGVKAYFDRLLAEAAERGYVETIMGRRRYFPELTAGAKVDETSRRRAQREAINAPIQGSAADITKVAMIRLHGLIRRHGMAARLLLQVHDELVLEVPLEELEAAAAMTREVMSGAASLSVPLTVDLSSGANWASLERLPAGAEVGR